MVYLIFHGRELFQLFCESANFFLVQSISIIQPFFILYLFFEKFFYHLLPNVKLFNLLIPLL